jgi:hypothetical protein
VIKGDDEDEDSYGFAGLSGEEAESLIERDDDDEDFDFLDDVEVGPMDYNESEES